MLPFAISAIAATALAQPPRDLSDLRDLPDAARFVLLLNGAAPRLGTDPGRALAAFVSEFGSWSRTAGAWTDLSRAMDIPPDQALATFLGDRFLFLADAAPPDAADFALVATVPAPVAARVRDRLRAAPRSLRDGVPILSLDAGACSLAIEPDSGAPSVALAVGSRDPGRLFDAALPMLSRARPSSRTLAAAPWWADAARLPAGDLLLLRHEPPAPGQPDPRFFALSARLDGPRLSAVFVTSPGMLAPEPALAVTRPWPGPVIEALEPDALLLVAGRVLGPRPVPLTLLDGLVSLVDLPPDLRAQVDGAAVAAIHERPSPGGPPLLTYSAAIPVRDLVRFAPLADEWLGADASLPASFAAASPAHPDHAPAATPFHAVRAITLGPADDDDSPLIRAYLRTGGVIAWTFVPGGPAGDGWWVITMRAGDAQARARADASRLASLLAAPSLREEPQLYRLSVRPARLREVLGDDGARVPAAVRWIESIESDVRARPGGVIEGEFVVRLNTAPLTPAPAR